MVRRPKQGLVVQPPRVDPILRITTWNVNSLAVRLPRVERWLTANRPDILCLQELKLEEERFPQAALEALGYRAEVFGQKTYNGVAVLAHASLPQASEVMRGVPDFPDPQARALAATYGELRVICLYVVNGQAVGSEKFAYKLAWLEAVTRWLEAETAKYPQLVVAGDFNIAPTDADVYDPVAWEGQVLCTEEERSFFRRWQALGLSDTFRLFSQPPRSFTWWDYRQLAFPKNLGLRIDHILASSALASRCREVRIDREERKARGEDKPSDHAPVTAVFA